MIETSSPGKLLLMLYDAEVRNLEKARIALDEKDYDAVHRHLVRAQDIILELMCSLNMDYEISKSLFSLYEYLHYQLVQANIKKEKLLVEEVLSFVIELRATWQEAIARVNSTRTSQAGAKSLDAKG